MRRVHWSATARRGELMVRRMGSPCRYSRVVTSSSLGTPWRRVETEPSLPRSPSSTAAGSSTGTGRTISWSVPPMMCRATASPKGSRNPALTGPMRYRPRRAERRRYS
ncbi:MAG: DUF58 domain-containing protein [Arthrobacter sp.]